MEQLAILLLGSNLGDRLSTIEHAVKELHCNAGQPENKSSVYESAPWGKTDQPPFLNQVVTLRTSLDPFALLEKCLSIEQSAGRVRTEPWGPRTLDIDILYFGNRIVDDAKLKIPHPGIPNRFFTLLPLCEIYPTMIHPESGKTHLQLMEACPDQGEVNLFHVHV
jgi:2-amino-4-hydroxy-6-hydroxymethyldihydropteridine diphosphokinase